MSIAMLCVLSMSRMDLGLYWSNPGLFMRLMVYQGSYILVSLLILAGLRKTNKVRIYDRLMLGWLSLTILGLLLFNFTRPANLLTNTYDVIILFAIYILSPLKISHTAALAFVFSAGTLLLDYFFKIGTDSAAFNTLVTAQFIVHALGLASSLQIQSF